MTERELLATVPKRLLIAGRWRDADSGATFSVEDPATGDGLAEVADAEARDALAALDAASHAQAEWAAWPPRERGEILGRAFDEIMARADQLALLLTLEMGNRSRSPVRRSRTPASSSAGSRRSRCASMVATRRRPTGRRACSLSSSRVGPCLLITPWNFPLAMATRKIAPAVAAGCTMIAKPAQLTPLSLLELAAILERAGLPPGVLNVLSSSSAGRVVDPLMEDPRLRKLSFTGSTEVGKRLMRQAAGGLLRTSLELGGNAPLLVFEDADLDKAVEGALLAKMRNMGQSCTAASRILVADSLADEFCTRLAERMVALRLGRGTEPDANVGPLIDSGQRRRVADLVGDAVARGGRIAAETPGLPERGYFVAPMLLCDVPTSAPLVREEVFGPVATVIRFSDEEEAVRLANDTPFGLVAFVFTENVRRALRVSEALETGMVGLNRGLVSNPAAPFGGVKHSGLGREGGPEGIDDYLALKYVALDS
jgi:succinate-semialdehyde dehydrogenase/glutarate-semialdehyde dehydrogenase